MAKTIAEITGCLLLLIVSVICACSFFLYLKVQDQNAVIQKWATTYADMLQKKDDELQRLRWQYRTTPPDKNEKPRPKGRG
jgi:hypothetical protein